MSGVPQGTVLGPLMFLLYINDISNNLTSHIRLFADDCIIYAMQKHLWCKKSEAKSEAPVTFVFCMRLKDMISGRGQGL